MYLFILHFLFYALECYFCVCVCVWVAVKLMAKEDFLFRHILIDLTI